MIDRSQNRPDRLFLFLIIVVMGLGLVIQYSASSALAAAKFNNPTLYFKGHLIRMLMGIVLCAFFAFLDYRHLKRAAFWLVLVSLGLLLTALVYKMLHPNQDTARWLPLGPFNLQPSEVAKLAVIMYAASFIDRHQRNLDDIKTGFLPPAFALSAILFLIVLATDFSSAAVIALIGMIVLIIGGSKMKHIFYLVGCYVLAAIPVVLRSPYRLARILTFFSPEQDVQGAGYQINQSLISLGNGGLFGSGLAGGIEKNLFLPDPHTDFIFAVVGEEFGFLGTTVLLTLFIWIFLKAIKIALRTPDIFGRLLGIGLATSMFMYVLLNVGVVCGLLPVTGLPLPFFSYGGSTMLFNFTCAGIILNLSRHTEKENQTIEPVVLYA